MFSIKIIRTTISSLSFQERSWLSITTLCCAPEEIWCPGKACVRAFAVSCIKIYPIDFSRKGCWQLLYTDGVPSPRVSLIFLWGSVGCALMGFRLMPSLTFLGFADSSEVNVAAWGEPGWRNPSQNTGSSWCDFAKLQKFPSDAAMWRDISFPPLPSSGWAHHAHLWRKENLAWERLGVGGASRGPSVCMGGCTNWVAPPCRARWRLAVRSHGDRSPSSCKIAFFPPLRQGLYVAWNSLRRSGLPGTQHLPPLPPSAGIRGVWYRAR